MAAARAFLPRLLRLAPPFLILACILPPSPRLSAQQPQMVDGAPLPTKGGIYAIDKTSSASNLVRLHPVEIKLNTHLGSNLARGMVYSGPRSTAEINGINADTHLHGTGLSFLVRVSDDEDDTRGTASPSSVLSKSLPAVSSPPTLKTFGVAATSATTT